MKTLTQTVYNFDELSDDAKETARSWYREGGFDYEWWDFIYDDAKEIGKLMGIDIENIYFRGFWSQGDGACFEGRYHYKAGSVKAVKEYAPTDTTLHEIVTGLYQVQKRNFYGLSANVKQRGNYSHERSTEIQVWLMNPQGTNDDYAPATTDETVSELLRDYMRWIYRQLNAEWDYMNSDEQVDETIRINEYTFDIDGNREG